MAEVLPLGEVIPGDIQESKGRQSHWVRWQYFEFVCRLLILLTGVEQNTLSLAECSLSGFSDAAPRALAATLGSGPCSGTIVCNGNAMSTCMESAAKEAVSTNEIDSAKVSLQANIDGRRSRDKQSQDFVAKPCLLKSSKGGRASHSETKKGQLSGNNRSAVKEQQVVSIRWF